MSIRAPQLYKDVTVEGTVEEKSRGTRHRELVGEGLTGGGVNQSCSIVRARQCGETKTTVGRRLAEAWATCSSKLHSVTHPSPRVATNYGYPARQSIQVSH